MTYDPQVVMRQRRDAREERDLKRWLRAASREERFAFISQCLEFRGYGSEKWALGLAGSCIADPEDALAILQKGFAVADASSIQFWLKFGVMKLGGQRVVREVAELLESSPVTVSKALYWLPAVIPAAQLKAVSAMRNLRAEAERRGVLRGPQTSFSSDGSVLFSNIYPEERN